jgi:pyruvate formate lyase activating enzyme
MKLLKGQLMAWNPEIKGNIFRVKRFSIHDGPGIRTSVFLKGCPLNCIWCHSPEGIDSSVTIWHNPADCIGCSRCVVACPEKALELIPGKINHINIDRKQCRLSGNCVEVCPSNAMEFTGYTETVPGIMREIVRDAVFYEESGGGVTLTGGEPLFQPEFAIEVLKACKSRNIHTAIETSLFCDKNTIQAFSEYVDLFITDIKIFDSETHLTFTGKSNEIIKENFCYIADSGKKITVRIPMIKNITDDEANTASIEQFVKGVRSDIQIEQISYNPLSENNYRKLGKPFLYNKHQKNKP